jgi:hypothetical protein
MLGAAAGYRHPAYAESLSEWGTPLWLGGCGGGLLKRAIKDSGLSDAMGAYPLFCCEDWSRLAEDLAGLADALVAVSLVADPFGRFDPAELGRTFDLARPFKAHFVARLDRPPEEYVTPRHAKHARRALKDVRVELCKDPAAHLEEWMRLYQVLIERHEIRGIRAFSREAFAAQLAVPGVRLFRALAGAETVGLDWWYLQDGVAQGHLAAFSRLGYDLNVSYAMKWRLLHHFTEEGAEWVNLGGGAGVSADSTDGLTCFKRGWSNGIKMSWLCGKILQPATYDRLRSATDGAPGGYFPAYRAGEFS